MPAGPNVGLSQDNLFFPLPITTPIENILQITNKEGSRVAYKVRSTIRNRYCVKPSVGFLHPKEESVVKFLLDPTSMVVDGHEPSEQTQDFFFIDFAFVDKEEEDVSPSAFWKSTKTRDITRRKLQCMYPKKTAVPESLVMRIETPKLQRIPSKIIGSIPDAATDFSAQKQKEVSGPADAAAAPVQAAPLPVAPVKQPEVPVMLPQTNAVMEPKPVVAPPEHVAVASPTPAKAQDPFLTKFLFFTIPVPFVVVLIAASFILALIEENTWLTHFLRSIRGIPT